ncbi:DMT family transporter [Akkermansiaceae bacterium]|nr:DMT family transporter [Akkermansiaceae bacterium]MDB4412538.1 DMT family transporter [bacterium]MDB4429408.1 DMT family transporter [Akkermansiaceae bacterium]MDB4546729.1 DMT family transporter [Akkermansiaceae bacterium]
MRIGDLLILLLLAALWGASFLFMRIAAPEFGPLPLVAFRMGLAGLALSFVFFQKEARESAKQHWWELLVSGVVGSSLAFILLSYATLTLSAGFTSLMNSSVPIFSAIIAAIWLKERLRLPQIIGLGFGVIGVGILVWGKLDFTSDGQGWPIAACIVACGCYGFGASWMKSKLSQVRPFVGSAGSLLGAALVLIPFALMQLPETSPSLRSWGSAVALALLCTALAFVFFFKLIQRSSATVATSVTFLIPFFAIFWGWLFLDEIVTTQMLLGLGVTLIGTSLITGVLGRPAQTPS